jgi:general secretion pathway protein K
MKTGMKKNKALRTSPAVARFRIHRKRAKQRGIALIMVLGAITVLTVFLTELQEDTTSELSSALAERDSLKAEYYARSAINLSRLLVALEPAVRKSVGPIASMLMGGKKLPQIPIWEFTDLVLGPFNSQYASASFTNAIGPADFTAAKNLGLNGGGHFELKIVDEDAKINLNEAAASTPGPEIRLGNRLYGLFAPTQYDTFFGARDGDGQFSDRSTICGALIDWADFDQNQFACMPPGTQNAPTNSGSEDSFYQTINQAYVRKDAPYDSLEELRLVRGVSDDFWNTFVDPDPTDPHKRTMTVWGQGTVNVNTANAQTILAIVCANAPEAPLCTDPTQMEGFIMGVTLAKSFLMGAPLFQSTSDFVTAMQGKGIIGQILTSLGVQPVVFKSAKDVTNGINVASKMFSIYADGVVPGYKKTTRVRIHAVVDFRAAAGINKGSSFGIGGVTPTLTSNVANGGAATSAQNTASSNQAAAMAGDPNAYATVLGKDPAGLMVYWRVE